MKECRDIVRELIAMMECGVFVIEAVENDLGCYYDYTAYFARPRNDGFGFDELAYDGLGFKINGDRVNVQLTSKESKEIDKAFTKAIDRYIISEGDTDGLDEIQAFLQE